MTGPRSSLRKGWCPGALRPMETGDGLLVRIRPRAGAWPLSALGVIAATASRCGSGEIDLTNRANLQLRGLTEATYPDAIAVLSEAGLIDASAAAESVRNVVVDPVCDLDPARIDMRWLGHDLETRLTVNSVLHVLPGKFGFSISGTKRPLPAQTTADIMISAHHEGLSAIRLDGDPRIHAVVDFGTTLDAVERLAIAFIDMAANDPSKRRMRDAVSAAGSSKIFASARLETRITAAARDNPVALIGVIGPVERPLAVGIGLPFGRITATELQSLCDLADAHDCREIRPSQQRTLIVPVRDGASAAALLAQANALELITTSDDPRLAMDVCSGAPSCRNATTNTRADARGLVAAFHRHDAPMPAVHISGCAKGCARRTSAALTFVVRDGLYDAVCDGPANGIIAMTGIAPQNLAAAARQLLSGRKP